MPYEFRSEVERCAHEKDVLRHWHMRGFSVPRLIEAHDVPEHALIIEYIDGVPLSSIMGDLTVSVPTKLSMIESLFSECSARHAKVLTDRDCRLIKYDANLRNIIVASHGIVHVDFEGGKVLEGVVRGSAREIARYAVEAVLALGEEHASTIVSCLLRSYTHQAPLNRIAKEKRRTLPRTFSTRHLARLIASH